MMDRKDDSDRIPIAEERLIVGKQRVETGRVRLTGEVEEEEKVIEDSLRRSTVRVERRPVDAVLERPPETRQEEGRLILPVYEEVLVKRFHLFEEVHVVREESEHPVEERVTLRRKVVRVDRDGED